MKTTLKRVLMLALALALMVGVMPVALAEAKDEPKAEPKASTKITYVGMISPMTVYDPDGNDIGANYKWSTSNKKVATVSSKGVITARKVGTCTITATSKTDKTDKSTLKLTVKKNKADKINSKPSVKSISYNSYRLVLKSVEIPAPNQVVAEYYVVCNAASSFKAKKLDFISDEIMFFDEANYENITIAKGKIKNVKVSIKGGQVKVVKVTYTGSMVKTTNVQLTGKKKYIQDEIDRSGALRR